MEHNSRSGTMRPARRKIGVTLAIGMIIATAVSSSVFAVSPTQAIPHAITVIPPGVDIESPQANSPFNRLILLAIPKLSSGDAKGVSSTVRDAATKCSLTLMASVIQTTNAAPQQKQFRLADVAAGYSVATDQGRIIVSSDKAAELGVSLGLIPNQVLKTSEQQLKKVQVVGRSEEIIIFDAPSMMHRRGQNRPYITRHFVYIDPMTGEGAMITWLLAPLGVEQGKTSFPVIDSPFRMTPFKTVEARHIHVDANEFNFFGFPSERAFGLVDLPPGNEVNWDKESAKLAGQFTYNESQLQSFSKHLARLLNDAK
ncbi:hypothetical protein LOC67_19095 [Stieleria sp. JC731]|uniref:hypothetical protein n=1 Tax=Pirellulaceae TaxID=2691357 RepID=UPI001E4BC615|nr:hypothetical protein [Stieleria sp. JC731]MCC9602662.1 hypothetical protein [Stieleria sp. JC731]